jgi:hypothetical protein
VKKIIKFNGSLSHKSAKNEGEVLYMHVQKHFYQEERMKRVSREGKIFFFLLLLS